MMWETGSSGSVVGARVEPPDCSDPEIQELGLGEHGCVPAPHATPSTAGGSDEPGKGTHLL